MDINSDFALRVVQRAYDANWSSVAVAGIERYMLDRCAGEVVRATSIVRYAPGAGLPAHVHHGGEEILVLAGAFADEHGSYPAGTYLRNPPGSAHAPVSAGGCTLLVKLGQFAADDRESLRIDITNAEWHRGLVRGLQVLPLHDHDGVSTALVRWAPNTQFKTHAHPGGEEILVLEGVFSDESGDFPAGTWIRSPRWSMHTPFTGAEGALIYVKVGAIGANFIGTGA